MYFNLNLWFLKGKIPAYYVLSILIIVVEKIFSYILFVLIALIMYNLFQMSLSDLPKQQHTVTHIKCWHVKNY